jgi:hypothetical protein
VALAAGRLATASRDLDSVSGTMTDDAVAVVAESAYLARESATDTRVTAAALLALSVNLQQLVDRFRYAR